MWTFKNGWLKQALNFVGPVISTWDLVLTWPKDSSGDPDINRLDKIAKQHVIDYSHAKNVQDKTKKNVTTHCEKNHASQKTFEIVNMFIEQSCCTCFVDVVIYKINVIFLKRNK